MMAKTEAKPNQDIPKFGIGEEITTCPLCGSRTDFLTRGKRDNRQLHWCLNDKCELIFMAEA